MTTYTIIRCFYSGKTRVIKRRLTLDEAKAHCKDPETSSSTCSPETKQAEVAKSGDEPWFDSYNEE